MTNNNNCDSEKRFRGLSHDEVLASRLKHGENVLTPPPKTPWWRKFAEKFRDPLIVVLLVAGLLSIIISIYEYSGLGKGGEAFLEPTGIFVAIILATGLAFIFEQKAEREFNLLNQLGDEEPVFVIRDGHATRIPRREVVVGDIVILNTGEEVPADGQLMEAVAMSVDESSLTGEPICHKSTRPQDADTEATFPTDCVLRGTKLMEGHGVMQVTAVGDATENGKVMEAARLDDSVRTPLNEQLDRLGKVITWASYGVASLVVVGRLILFLTTEDFEWVAFLSYLLETIMIAVTLIVVAVPEGLPMAVTLSLAYSMRRMLKTNNLVRKMHACETMGAATVICTDKTGTLTQNQMRVAETTLPQGDDLLAMVAEGIAVNSTASLDTDKAQPEVLGNPTEGALLLWLWQKGIDYRPLRRGAQVVSQLPFSTDRKYMATLVVSQAAHGKRVLFVKGAPEIVMTFCGAMTSEERSQANRQLSAYQQKAMRTLALAYMPVDDDRPCFDSKKLLTERLTFLGLVAISDPVRPEVPAAVSECLHAGIDVKIVTGDTSGTAVEIARQIGLWHDGDDPAQALITGPQLAALSDEQLAQRAAALKVVSRARPMDKKRLVEALRSRGQVVAVTGDGTNDAPALKAAHVGLSMGDGTSVAKEASDITIIDNSFCSIGRAVMWGRSLYRNIQKFIIFQMTVNVVACLVVLCGAFMDKQSPLTVTQMLWVNLIMDTFAAMALASLPPSHAVMADKPRDRKAFIITKAMGAFVLIMGGVFSVILLALLHRFEHDDIRSMTDLFTPSWEPSGGLSSYELSLFFTIFVALQFWNLFNVRAYLTRKFFSFKRSWGFNTIVLIVLVGQVLIVQCGGRMFNTVPLSLADWLIIIAASSLVLLIGMPILYVLNTYRSGHQQP